MERNQKLDLSRDQRRIQDALRGLQVLIDIIALYTAFALGYVVRQNFPLFAVPINPPTFDAYAPLLLIHIGTLLVLFFFARLYHQKRAVSRIDLAYNIAASASVGVVMTSGLTTIFLKGTIAGIDYPRQMILYVWVFSVLFAIIGRELHQLLVVRLRISGVASDRVVVIGNGSVAEAIIAQIRANPDLGYVIVGTVNDSAMPIHPLVPHLGVPEDLPNLIAALNVDEVIIATPDATRADLVHLTSLSQQRGNVNVKIYPDTFAYMAGAMSIDELGGIPLLSMRDVALRGWKLTLKRALDVAGAAVGLVILSPIMLLISTIIKLESPGPVFFSQERAGLDGLPFPMMKFRTMRTDAEKRGPGWTVKNDPRVTRFGKFLRTTNLDELPNFINVLMGHMSLVGPRPEQTAFVQQFREKIPRYMERHREKAGMTGWAQVNGLRGDTSIEERIKYDIWYVENWSIWLDLKILLRTIVQTISRKSPNAY